MKWIFAAFALMLNINAFAQTLSYEVSKDPKEEGGLIYNGPITFDDLNKETAFTWLKSGSDEYKPNAKVISYLGAHLKEYSLVIFLGTWCSDSQDLIPKLEKVLEEINYPLSSLAMYGTDRSKKTKNKEDRKYHITLVPTIILLKNGKEAGRITESVKKSIEADIAAIIKRNS